ncbi:MAG: energy-coupling factor transporter transmembrane protein EcfT [Frankiaceae bacterium]|nr:energy-coupling factor transporter transmembrane protein EcfT [Frankiaceae bacterium]MBV9872931.1 energy-coupling factor transporter transmembrane protein EcfT [Frankiaceae bacterium]
MTHRLPRLLHPGAWWLWATTLAIAASRTTNPLLLVAIIAITGYVVASRRPASPWSASYAMFLTIGLVCIGVRLTLFALVGGAPGTHILVRLPVVPLPHWMAGVRLGGPITAEGLAASAYDGLRLGVILCCIGAANALTSPRRLLKSLPGALYEAGVAVTVALAFAPQAVAAVGRLRAARRIRGRHDRGVRRIRGLAIPVLEGALDRSVDLAAAMDARGFGRNGAATQRVRRTTAALTLAGLLAMVASTYGLVARSAPAGLGVPLLVGGAALTAAGFIVGAKRGGRTRYRPDPWRLPEWLVALTGIAAATGVLLGPARELWPSTYPLVAPPLPAVPFLALLVAVLPAWIAPPLPRVRAAGSTTAARSVGSRQAVRVAS